MSQATAKNLRELLKKHQQAAKVQFGKNCSCQLKNCILCLKKPGSRVVSPKKINLSISKSNAASSQVNSQVSTNRHIPDTKPIDQQLFLQQQLQIHLTKKKDSKTKLVSSSRHSFYDHMESYLNSYYSSNKKMNSQSKHKNVQSLMNMESEVGSWPQVINKHRFKFLYVIGKGGFGRVWKVECKKSKKMYALKEMAKSKLGAERELGAERAVPAGEPAAPIPGEPVVRVQRPREPVPGAGPADGGRPAVPPGEAAAVQRGADEVLRVLHPPRAVLPPRERHHPPRPQAREPRPRRRGVHAPHRPGHRAPQQRQQRHRHLRHPRLHGQVVVGVLITYSHPAPEVMCRLDHSVMVDYYALGVIAYELMLGRRPYNGRSRQEIKEQILARQVQVKPSEAPCGWTDKALDFINRLIQRKPEKRLGANGIRDIIDHDWLRGYNWDDLLHKKTKSNYVPGAIDDNFDYQNQISEETQLDEHQLNENRILLRRKSIQQLFDGYEFDKTDK